MPCFLMLLDRGTLFSPKAPSEIPWKSILWVTPLETCVLWSRMGQVVMVLYWRNWLVYTNKGRGSQIRKLTIL